jgi:collagen type III alpha
VQFDDLKPGPILNPANNIWFSEGFLVAPPSSQPQHPYFPTSGGQLVEYVPLSLSSATAREGSGDTAEVGLGPNSVNSCFRFNFYGANLGCAAESTEGWCEFEISAYTYDPNLSHEQSIAWSETKMVPACPNYPNGPCALTPIQLEGYTNITSVLITLHVGLETRVWWGDDFEFGWTDDSCEAATCRANTPSRRVKREAVKSVLRKGVWHWSPSGLERLDDEYVWDATH